VSFGKQIPIVRKWQYLHLQGQVVKEDCLNRKMEAPKSFKNLVTLQSTPRRNRPEEGNLPVQVTWPLSW